MTAPAWQIAIAGKALDFDRRTGRLSVTDNAGQQADALSLEIADHDGRVALPRRGVTLAVRMGWRGGELLDMGEFVVDGIEHSGPPDKIVLSAHSANLATGLTEKKQRSWHGYTLGDIVQTIAKEQDLTPAIAQALSATAIDHIDQTDESDAHFLTRLAQRYGAAFAVKQGRLVFTPQGTATTVSGKALPAVAIARRDGDEHRFAESDREHYTGVRAGWHDTASAQNQTVLVGEKGHVRSLRTAYPTAAEAKAAAAAEWRRLQRGAAGLSLTVQGNPRLRAETPVTLAGFKAEIMALDWVVHTATHTLDGSGYRTALELLQRDPSA